MEGKPMIAPKDTTDLTRGDIVIKYGDNDRIVEAIELIQPIEPISCKGLHFKAKDEKGNSKQVCYLPGGRVIVMRKEIPHEL